MAAEVLLVEGAELLLEAAEVLVKAAEVLLEAAEVLLLEPAEASRAALLRAEPRGWLRRRGALGSRWQRA